MDVLGRQVRIEHVTLFFRDKPCLGTAVREQPARDRIPWRVILAVQVAEYRGEEISIPIIRVIHRTERVSCALSGEGSVVGARKEGPVACGGVRELAVVLHHRPDIPTLSHPEDTTRGGLGRAREGL